MHDAPTLPSVRESFESALVDSASRVLLQAQREAIDAVQAALSGFLTATASKLGTGDSAGASLLAALGEAAGVLGALGPPVADVPSTIRQAHGIDALYSYNVSDSWKRSEATALGFGDDPPASSYQAPGSPVYWRWVQLTFEGSGEGNEAGVVPEASLNLDSLLAMDGSTSWWTPSERMDLPPATGFPEAKAGYVTALQVVSLAPDWYRFGAVLYDYPRGDRELLRPTAYDGANPLWVQRAMTEPARTGGGAVEVLTQGAVPLLAVQYARIRAYPLDADTQAALAKAPSVDLYGANLAWTEAGVIDGLQQEVAAWQRLIVQEARAARTEADAVFAQLAWDRAVQGSAS